MPNQKCLDRSQLQDFVLGKLPETAEDSLVAHLDTCPSCEAAVAAFDDASDDVVRSLRGPKQPEEFEAEAELAAALARVKDLPINPPPADAAASDKQPEEATSENLGELRDYRLLEKIGEGGMGAVYKAMHTKLDKIVALKVLPSHRIRDERAIGRFHREMKAVGRLEHPNIVGASDAGEADGRHFLVMQYVNGIDLAALMGKVGRLPVAEACELIRQAATGLQFVHEQGMVHRDIKPSNLMVTGDGQVKLLDLGLALLHDQPDVKQQNGDTGSTAELTSDLTAHGQLMGTLDYMAPEQCDDSHQVDIRADIYSLGATLYKLLAGTAPFGDTFFDTPIKKMIALSEENVPPLQTKRPDVPASLAGVIRRMLAKKASQRFATPADVANALSPFAESSDLPGWLAAELSDVLPAPAAETLMSVGGLEPMQTATQKTKDEFDPYYKWLAIPPEEQPPNHYRLLGLKEFEVDEDVISVSADRQMVHIRTFQSGKYSKQSQKLLNEIAAAKICLLNRAKRAAYDERLRTELDAKQAAAEAAATAVAIPTAAPPAPAAPAAKPPVAKTLSPVQPVQPVKPEPPSVSAFKFSTAEPQREARRKVQRRKQPVWQALAAGSAVALLIVIGAALFLASRKDDEVANLGPTDSTPAVPVADHSDAGNGVLPSADPIAPPPAATPDGSGNNVATDKPATTAPATVSSPDLPVTPVEPGARVLGASSYKTISASTERTMAVAWSPDEKWIATGSGLERKGNDFNIRLWDPVSFEKVKQFVGHSGAIAAVSFSPDSQRLASASLDGSMRVWNVADGSVVWSLDDNGGEANAVQFSPDGMHLAVGGKDGLIKIVDVETKNVVHRVGRLPNAVICLDYSPDGKMIGCGTYSKGLWLIDAVAGDIVAELSGHAQATTSVAFSPDGRTLASGSYHRPPQQQLEGTIKLWSVAERRELTTFSDRVATVWSLAFSPGGAALVSAHHDRVGGTGGVIRIWDMETKSEITALKGHTAQVYDVAFSPEGRRLASVSHDATLRIWNVEYASPATHDEPATPTVRPSVESQPPPETVVVKRLPIPNSMQRDEALNLIRQAYPDAYAKALKPEEKTAFANKLFRNAGTEQANASLKYVLLNEARQFAVDGGDPELALQIVQEMVDQFELDIWAAKEATIRQVAAKVRDSQAKAALAEVAVRLGDAAIDDDRLDAAEVVSRIASAQSNLKPMLRRQAAALKTRVTKLKPEWDVASEARRTLAANEDDAGANLTLGKYLCFSRGDWQIGLSHLAKGSDAELQALAQQEISQPDSPGEQLQIAEAWWKFHESLRDQQKTNVIAHCESWYKKALPELAATGKTLVTNRLDEIDRLLGRESGSRVDRQLIELLQKAIFVMNFEPEHLDLKSAPPQVRDLTGINGLLYGAQPCPGIAGGGLLFNGRGEHVRIDPLRDRLRADLRALSISIWIKSHDRRVAAFAFDTGFYGQTTISVVQNGGTVNFRLPRDLYVGGAAEPGQWHHIVGVWNGKAMGIYIDGVFSKQTSTASFVLNKETVGDEPPRIGKQAKPGQIVERSFNGVIDELAIFPAAISPQEVQLLYDTGRQGQPLGHRPTRTPVSKPAQGDWVNVLDQITDEVIATAPGTWQMVDGTLVLAKPAPGITTILDVPTQIVENYDVRAVSMTKSGDPQVSIRLPIADRSCQLLVDSWPTKGGRTYIHTVDGVTAGEHPDAVQGRLLRLNQLHTHEVAVRLLDGNKATVAYALDGQKIFTWSGSISSLVSERSGRFGIGSYSTQSVFPKFDVRFALGSTSNPTSTSIANRPVTPPPTDDTVTNFWQKKVDALAASARDAETNEHRGEIARAALASADEAIAADAFDAALTMLDTARDLATRAKVDEFVKQTRLRSNEVNSLKRQHQAAEEARQELVNNPDDVERSMLVGRYLCFVRDRWSEGLPYLAKTDDARLKTAVDGETSSPADVTAMQNLGESWIAASGTAKGDRDAMIARACHWYGRALSGLSGPQRAQVEKILAQYDEGFRQATFGLVGHWKFDETEGAVAHDTAGQRHISIGKAKWAPGRMNGAVQFDEQNKSYVVFPQADFGNTLTIAIWVANSKPYHRQTLFATSGSALDVFVTGPHHFPGATTGTVVAQTASGNSTANAVSVKSALSCDPKRWHHVVVTVDRQAGQARIYVDGQDVTQRPNTLTSFPTDRAFRIGANANNGYHLHGRIDDLRIYNRVLSAKEVQNLFAISQ